MAEPPDPLIGTTISERFELTGLLGRGGFGRVYRGVQHPVGREVAVKVLLAHHAHDDEVNLRFFNEARSISALRSRHTIGLYDFGTMESGALYMVLEFARGRTLKQIIKDEGPMDIDRVLRITAQVCESLAEAHAAGIIHRDLKPENIIIETRARHPDFAKVLDFGIAKLKSGDGATITATGALQGTPAFMSPEQCSGQRATHVADLYSLGVIMYQLLAGRLPFVAEEALGFIFQHVQNPPPPLAETAPEVPPEVAAIVEKLLEKAPADRFQSADELRECLLAVLGEPDHGTPVSGVRLRTRSAGAGATMPTTTRPAGAAEGDSMGPGRSRWVVAGLALLVAGGLGAWWALGRSPAPAPPPAPTPAPTAATTSPPASGSAAERAATMPSAGDDAPAEPSRADPAATGAEVGAPVEVMIAQEPLPRRPRADEPMRTDRRPTATMEEADARRVWLDVTTRPAGASVQLDAEVVCVTPCRRRLWRSAEPLDLRVSKPGYKRVSREVSLNADVALDLELPPASRRPRPRPKAKEPRGHADGLMPPSPY